MSMSNVLSVLRGAGRKQLSASTITARQATGSHVLRIDGFTQVTNMAASGQVRRSGEFSVGRHDWRIRCYPNGCKGHEGYISFFLEHASHDFTGDATAKLEISILDEASKPTFSKTTSDYLFNKDGFASGWNAFIKHEDLHKGKHLKDDCLTVPSCATLRSPPICVPRATMSRLPCHQNRRLSSCPWRHRSTSCADSSRKPSGTRNRPT
jgi:speckle-type POZ protein